MFDRALNTPPIVESLFSGKVLELLIRIRITDLFEPCSAQTYYFTTFSFKK